MILARSPLRISLGGGGTDLPSYYVLNGGFVVAAAIDRYVYIAVNERFDGLLSVRYNRMEVVKTSSEVAHPIVREALKMMRLDQPGVDIASMADVPAGTGMGSSGSFTTALLRALHAHKQEFISPQRLARLACTIEIDILGEPIGKQDQYVAAFGGISQFTFLPDGSVEVEPLSITRDTSTDLEEHLVLFYTGLTRSASMILTDQTKKSTTGDSDMLHNLTYIKELGYEVKRLLEAGDCEEFGRLLNAHWEWKRRRSQGISNPEIDHYYSEALLHGALGGKLIGAGGGGFLLFYASDKRRLRSRMRDLGLSEMRFRFDHHGTRVLTGE